MDRLTALLNRLREDGLHRELHPCDLRGDGRIVRDGTEYLDFSSNDYLALSAHPALKQAAQQAVARFGTGAAASRLLSGDLNLFHELEARVAAFQGKPAALVYNSGYHANTGVLSALCEPADVVLCDRLSHASLLDGIRLSGARFSRFRHNDIEHLESLLRKWTARGAQVFVVTESVFSMDGDHAPLADIAALKRRHEFTLIVDEAHATGVFGPGGAGLVAELGVREDIDLIVATFGKALGSFGAYVACSAVVRDLLINTSRSFIYSTALPPPVIAANLAALDLLEREPQRRESLLARSKRFRQQLREAGFPTPSQSQIVPVVLGATDAAVRWSRDLARAGIWTLPIRPPTVPASQARLRFSLTYAHQPEALDGVVESLRGRFRN